jgi:hypothetical protein
LPGVAAGRERSRAANGWEKEEEEEEEGGGTKKRDHGDASIPVILTGLYAKYQAHV